MIYVCQYFSSQLLSRRVDAFRRALIVSFVVTYAINDHQFASWNRLVEGSSPQDETVWYMPCENMDINHNLPKVKLVITHHFTHNNASWTQRKQWLVIAQLPGFLMIHQMYMQLLTKTCCEPSFTDIGTIRTEGLYTYVVLHKTK